MNTKLCGQCGMVLPVAAFNKRARYNAKYQSACRACSRDLGRKWYALNRREVIGKARAYQDSNPEKRAAHGAVNDAVRLGRLIKPMACETCAAIARLDGHHDDYSKPLEVRWLCRPCHLEAHRAIA